MKDISRKVLFFMFCSNLSLSTAFSFSKNSSFLYLTDTVSHVYRKYLSWVAVEIRVEFGNQLRPYSKRYFDKCNLRQCFWGLRVLKLLAPFAIIIDTHLSKRQEYRAHPNIFCGTSPIKRWTRCNMMLFKVIKKGSADSKCSFNKSCNTVVMYFFFLLVG